MTPLHELLSRIRWDPEFGRGDFVLGYWDRVLRRIVRVPMRDVSIDPHDHFGFRVLDEDGVVHDVPFHRVRQVLRDGAVIWSRGPGPG